ncbi:hypothetical protein FRC06_002010 [Ceratobasidium sp. 370]|nr:hypothetical protein FRC06_002010 [Ceratobasidium sp. 370]
MTHLLPLWGYEEKETWAKRSFPQSVFTYASGDWNGIQGWPNRVSRKLSLFLHFETEAIVLGQGLHKLCYERYWVGGYPILNVTQADNPTKRTDPGQFRILVSGAYVDKQTDNGRVNAFAFCGLARLLDPSNEDSYQMCWPNGSRSEVTEEDITF